MASLVTPLSVCTFNQLQASSQPVLTFKAYSLRDAPTVLTFNNCTLCPHCIYVFCIYLRTNSDLCHLHHKLIGFYNRDEKCLQRGTNWVFKYNSLRFVFKGLNKSSSLLTSYSSDIWYVQSRLWYRPHSWFCEHRNDALVSLHYFIPSLLNVG